ncbi:MAG TPA: EAL domain-containing protein, partial [Pseudolabrys sp.]|nr:EAL domain-containing protein [Pseudolabrys sp.]
MPLHFTQVWNRRTPKARAHGVPHNVRLAIDNFGRAYSTLAKAEEMPFEELKLDKSFVADCGTDKVNAPLCKTVIDLAHSFG